jgi:hypothetical protein
MHRQSALNSYNRLLTVSNPAQRQAEVVQVL